MADPRLTIPTRRNLADRETILRLVLAAGVGGIRAAVLMIEVKRSAQCVGSHLVALEDAGLIERSSATGNGCKWGPPGTWAHHQGARDREAARRVRRRSVMSDAEYEASLHPVRVSVPSHLAEPMRQRPACSVWEFAARGGYG